VTRAATSPPATTARCGTSPSPATTTTTFYVIAQAGDVPVLVHNCGVSDTRIISSSQSREQNLASINVRPSGTGFNAIYDPADGSFEARLSEGEDALVVWNEGHPDHQ